MRRFRELQADVRPSYRPVIGHDQAFDTLTFPAPGPLAWTTFNRIICEWGVQTLPEAFALIDWPTLTLPLFIRANSTRYALNTIAVGQPHCYSVPYAGQVLPTNACFELWSGITAPGSITLPAFTMTISYRTQLCCGETTGEAYNGSLYSPYCRPYPIYLPICTS